MRIKGQLTEAEWGIDGLHWGPGVLAVSISGPLHCPYLPCIIDLLMYVYDLLLPVCVCVCTRACVCTHMRVLHMSHTLSSASFTELWI